MQERFPKTWTRFNSVWRQYGQSATPGRVEAITVL